MRIRHLIGGKAVDSGETFETLNPATQAVLAEVAAAGEAEVHAAVAAAKAAFPKWAGTPASERAQVLHKMGELIAEQRRELARMETEDTGQPIAQTRKAQVQRAAEHFHYFAEMCVRVDGHTYPTPTHLNYTQYHPVGVCALISPWNVPLMTAPAKLAPCLAFGNTAVLKASQLAPLSAARLAELALEAGFPPGVLNLVHGTGHEAGELLVRHPDVRVISFTGSAATGQRIVHMSAHGSAPGGLKKYSLELGGKSPVVIFDDADLDRAMDAALFMAFSQNGERGSAGSRILVQRGVYADFAVRFADRAQRIAVGDPLDERTVIGPMISAAHQAKVRGYIDIGSREGASLLCGGPGMPSLPQDLQRGHFVRPTVFADVHSRMRIAQEEIFGPVVCLMPFDDEEDATRLANDTHYGLASCVWTENVGRAHRMAAAIDAGMCFVNSQDLRDLRQPWGGNKASGIGREGGTWSHEVFLEPRSVSVSLGSHTIPHWGL